MADIIEAVSNILDEIDNQLDGVTSYMDNLTELINQEIENNREQAQEIINEKVSELTEKLTDKLQPIRDKIVNIFSTQFSIVKQKVEKYIEPIKNFVSINWTTGTVTPNVPTNPNDLPQVIIGIITMLVPAPAIEFVAKFAIQIMPKITIISDKIQQIANYQPQIDIPEVEVPPLNVNIEPITLQDITGNNNND